MTYYPDLSPYTYDPTDKEMLNIGWLSREHSYPTGATPDGLVYALIELAKNKTNMQRGMHFCDLCPDFETAQLHTFRGKVFIGSGEIRLTDRQGVTFSSPAMIVHYVEDHAYLPPEDYCTAVLSSTRGTPSTD
ncbi:hypothetical protein NX801_27680 [Streptomyces sp. LP05-1]|uniref:DUF7919 domain-containing protein n=1 Tax=Streptomyces pyxinae TaxID=2970734 RepID=A0ABT2CQ12_9ACTN|nr:hypothetical protein [Streptomyces sp. LP05-1]MCS0639351.1 hypothetical protein [Streptomyces sp. LP05-1]